MAFKFYYKASVAKDLKKLPPEAARTVLNKFEKALRDDLDAGEPLKGEFKGLFRYRAGDYRVIFARVGDGVLVLRIRHGKDAYSTRPEGPG